MRNIFNNNYTVRDFQVSDAILLSKMIRQDILSVNTEDPEWEREYLYNFYTPENIIENSKKGHVYVIEDKNTGALVATGMIKKDSPARAGAMNESEISACFVDSNKLRRGLGTLFFDTLENDIYFLTARRVWLTTSVYATSFYENRGYKYSFGFRKKNQDNLTEMEKIPCHK